MVDVCMHGTIWPSSKLASWNARYTTPCCDVAGLERRGDWLSLLGCQLLWEGNSCQCRGWAAIFISVKWHKAIFNFMVLKSEQYTTQMFSVLLQIKFRRGLPPGDGVLYYPGEAFSQSHQPVASVRLERLLSGLQVCNLTVQIWSVYLKCLYMSALFEYP